MISDKAIAEIKALREHDEEMERIEKITVKELRERHRQEIEDFRDTCRHLVISDWLQYMWAPGHYDGHVKVCDRCGKIMEERP
jgi:hypothetical protein